MEKTELELRPICNGLNGKTFHFQSWLKTIMNITIAYILNLYKDYDHIPHLSEMKLPFNFKCDFRSL